MTFRSRLLRWFALLLALVLVAAACSSSGDSGDETSTGDDGAGEETTEETEESGADCLVGEWTMDRASYTESFGGFLERVGGPALGDESSGDIRLTIDGTRFVATFEEFNVVLILPGGAGETRVLTNGDQSGEYTAADDVVALTALESTLETETVLVVDGVETDAASLGIDPTEFFQQNLFNEPMGFTCEGDRLELRQQVPDLDEIVAYSWERTA